MYGISVDRGSAISLVRQLCESIRERVLDGRIPPDSRLPSTRLFAVELGVARNVVTDAYEQLEAEGYLKGAVGSGTIVTALAESIGMRAARDRRRAVARGASAVRGGVHPAGLVIDFASACGIPDIASFPYRTWKRCMAEALDSASPADLSFSDIRGARVLRDEIQAMLFRMRGISCDPDQIFVTRGITHALSLVCRFLRNRAGSALLEDPLLNSFKRELAAAGYEIGYVPVDEEGFDTGAIPASGEGSLFVVSPSHQFPTGGILPISRRLELLSAAEARSGWIFEDDYDGELRLRGLPVPPIMTLENERVFYSGGFNKTMFPAMRTGYLVVPERIADHFASFRLGVSDWMETIPGKALAAFIRAGHYERRVLALKRLYSRRRERVLAGISSVFGEGASARGAEAGCHCRIALNGAAAAGTDWEAAPASGVKIATVARYLSAPRSSARRFKDDILIGYGNLDDEALGEGLARLRRFVLPA
jgi:GntR family transcriptional regulator / MocR family aminotransferase